jgi:hypothetical protein
MLTSWESGIERSNNGAALSESEAIDLNEG